MQQKTQPKVHPNQDFQWGMHPQKNPDTHCKIIFVSLGIQSRTNIKKVISKFTNQFLSKFSKLSTVKKIVLIMFVLFGVFWYWATKTFYYYIIHTLGIPQLSSISGFSVDTIDWLFITLPFYIKIVTIVIIFPIIAIIIIRKKRTKKSTP